MDKAKPCCRRSAYCGECFELTRRDRKYCSRKCLKRKASNTLDQMGQMLIDMRKLDNSFDAAGNLEQIPGFTRERQ